MHLSLDQAYAVEAKYGKGWKPWGGGECPVEPDTKVEVLLREDLTEGHKPSVPAEAYYYQWNHQGSDDDIVFYRPAQATLMKSLSPCQGHAVEIEKQERLSGGSQGYYKVLIEDPTSASEPYIVECNDIIEALQMNYAEANVFKAIWRIAQHRRGEGKPGNEPLYDAEKAEFFSTRLVKQLKRETLMDLARKNR
jgi:hypothetical protein